MVMVSHIVGMRWMSQGYENSRVEAHSGGEVAGQVEEGRHAIKYF